MSSYIPLLKTKRLYIEQITVDHSNFMLELVNTKGWLEFIGNRNVNNSDDAEMYIRKILYNPAMNYRVVSLEESKRPIGIISVVKRDYLDNLDIGFAFLPEFMNKGYAYEAASSVLKALEENENQKILAVLMPSNQSSVRLLNKLGLQFDHEMEMNGETLHVFATFSRSELTAS